MAVFDKYLILTNLEFFFLFSFGFVFFKGRDMCVVGLGWCRMNSQIVLTTECIVL